MNCYKIPSSIGAELRLLEIDERRVSFCQLLLDGIDNMTRISLFWLSAGDFTTTGHDLTRY